MDTDDEEYTGPNAEEENRQPLKRKQGNCDGYYCIGCSRENAKCVKDIKGYGYAIMLHNARKNARNKLIDCYNAWVVDGDKTEEDLDKDNLCHDVDGVWRTRNELKNALIANQKCAADSRFFVKMISLGDPGCWHRSTQWLDLIDGVQL